MSDDQATVVTRDAYAYGYRHLGARGGYSLHCLLERRHAALYGVAMGVLNTVKNVLGYSCLACAVSLAGTHVLNKRMVNRFMGQGKHSPYGELHSVSVPRTALVPASTGAGEDGLDWDGDIGDAGATRDTEQQERLWFTTVLAPEVDNHGSAAASEAAGLSRSAEPGADVQVVVLTNVGTPSFEWHSIARRVASSCASNGGRTNAARLEFVLPDRDGYGYSPLPPPNPSQQSSAKRSIASRSGAARGGTGKPEAGAAVQHHTNAVAHAVGLRQLVKQVCQTHGDGDAGCVPRPKLVLVGHGLGSLYAAVFSALFPRSVAAMVLVDPLPPPSELPNTHLRWLDQVQS